MKAGSPLLLSRRDFRARLDTWASQAEEASFVFMKLALKGTSECSSHTNEPDPALHAACSLIEDFIERSGGYGAQLPNAEYYAFATETSADSLEAQARNLQRRVRSRQHLSSTHERLELYISMIDGAGPVDNVRALFFAVEESLRRTIGRGERFVPVFPERVAISVLAPSLLAQASDISILETCGL